MIRISKTSKLGCLSWSLQAIETCPGSVGADGGLVEVCRGCYATQGNYRFANVKAPRAENKEDWKREGWVEDMVAALKGQTHFRWFDSGDCYSLQLAEKIKQVIEQTPGVKHWMPTRMHKFTKFAGTLQAIQSLPNAVVRYSGDDVVADSYTAPDAGFHSAVIADPTVAVSEDVTVCEAYSRDGKCGTCRACWSKDVPAIAYPAHGKAMAKVIRIKAV